MTSEKARWRLVLMSYPCPDCGAGPGQRCVTSGGRWANDYVHAARVRDARRCPRCGQRLSAEAEAGDLCDHCAVVASLEAERYRRPPLPKEGQP